MSATRPKLGAVFRGEAPPDRTAGLAGLLAVTSPPRPSDVADQTQNAATEQTSTNETEPQVQDQQPAARPAEPAASNAGERALTLAPARQEPNATDSVAEPAALLTKKRPKKPDNARAKSLHAEEIAPQRDDTDEGIKMVPANIDVSVHADLRQFASRNELSFATVVLRAIEANADKLSTTWTQARSAVKTGLFGATEQRSGRRRTEPAVQIQLRIPIDDAAVLHDLVDSWQAPSRGVMITEALRLYLPSSLPGR